MMNEIIISQDKIESLIFTIRGVQVMLDRDLSDLYEVPVKVLNQAVKRNIERFPSDFYFQLSKDEVYTAVLERCLMPLQSKGFRCFRQCCGVR